MTDSDIQGGCTCGAIRYRAGGAPTNSMICHCRTCRRVAAAPVVAWLTFPRSGFEIARGRPARFQSSEPVVRTFCNVCGTQLTYAHRDAPNTIDVTTCSLDDPNRFPPTHHSWLEHDLAWIRFGDGLPTFAQFRPPPTLP